MYANLGIKGSTVLLIAGLYGMVGPATNVYTILNLDKWGRRRTMSKYLIHLHKAIPFPFAEIATLRKEG